MPEQTPHSEPSPDPSSGHEPHVAGATEGTTPGEPINDLSQAGYQPEGVPAGHLLGLIGMTLVSIAAVVLTLYFVFYAPFKDHRQQVAEDVDPNVREVELRAEAVAALESYGLTADSSFRIPVTEAMEKLASADTTVTQRSAPRSRQSFNTGWIDLLPAPAVASVGNEQRDRDVTSPSVSAEPPAAPETEH